MTQYLKIIQGLTLSVLIGNLRANWQTKIAPVIKKIDIKILQHGNKVEGFGGCNGFGGNYKAI